MIADRERQSPEFDHSILLPAASCGNFKLKRCGAAVNLKANLRASCSICASDFCCRDVHAAIASPNADRPHRVRGCVEPVSNVLSHILDHSNLFDAQQWSCKRCIMGKKLNHSVRVGKHGRRHRLHRSAEIKPNHSACRIDRLRGDKHFESPMLTIDARELESFLATEHARGSNLPQHRDEQSSILRPVEHHCVENAWFLRCAAPREFCEGTRSCSVNRFAVHAHPCTDTVQHLLCVIWNVTTRIGTDIEQQVSALRHDVAEKPNDRRRVLPIHIVRAVTVTLIQRVINFPIHVDEASRRNIFLGSAIVAVAVF